MKNKTAVDCLIEQLTNEGIYIPFGFYEQAKEMEKKQIIQTYHKSALNEATHIIAGTLHISAEQYYNETYGNKTADT